MSRVVTTRCVATGPIDPFVRLAFAVSNRGFGCDGLVFDFYNVIPMPLIIQRIPRCISGAYDDDESAALKELKRSPDLSLRTIRDFIQKSSPAPGSLDELKLSALIQTGYTNQTDWLLGNWGSVGIGVDVGIHHHAPGIIDFIFDTSPVFPLGIFRRLAQMFPDVRFHCGSCEEAGEDAREGCFNGAPDFQEVPLTAQLYEWVRGAPFPYADDPAPHVVHQSQMANAATPPSIEVHHVPQ